MYNICIPHAMVPRKRESEGVGGGGGLGKLGEVGEVSSGLSSRREREREREKERNSEIEIIHDGEWAIKRDEDKT